MNPTESMALAIQEAKKGLGRVAPNPPVGCVILDKNREFISSGFHREFGGPHAEIEALVNLNQEQLKGAHVYVTLEPCAHQGKTPSCAEKLAALPIASLTYGVLDPNPLVNGKGIEKIRAAGISVAPSEEFEVELNEMIEIFAYNMEEKRPFVALKVATSLDGQMGMKSGESQWISNEASREDVQFLRGVYDCELIGVGTLLSDNPRLNSRHVRFKEKENTVVVLDPEGKCVSKIESMNVSSVRPKEKILVITENECTYSAATGFDLDELMRLLYDRGITSVLVEGGSQTFSSFINQRIVNRVYIYMAPKIIGGDKGLNWTSLVSIPNLKSSVSLKNTRTEDFKGDLRITGLIEYD